MTISEYEKEIEIKRDVFYNSLEKLIAIEKSEPDNINKLQNSINQTIKSGNDYFKKFESSISLYESEDFKAGTNIQIAKINSTKIILDTILNFWQLLDSIYKPIDELSIPSPHQDAYTIMQQFLKSHDPESATALQQKFSKNKLPTNGFEAKKKINPVNSIIVTKKQQITFGLITGVVFLIALMVITLVFGCQVQQSDKIFTIILALAGAAFAMAITGTIGFSNKVVSAGGPLAVFALIFFFNPAQVDDFKSCQKDFSGTVYFGDKPMKDIRVGLIKSDQSTESNDNGNFTFKNVDFSSLGDEIKINLKNREIDLDTILNLSRKEIKSSVDLYVSKYCITCTQKDSLGSTVGRKNTCAATKKYISGYINRITQESMELGLTVVCEEE